MQNQDIPMLEDVKDDEESNDISEEGLNFAVNEKNEYYYPKSCYTCKNRFIIRHHFYDRVSN